MAKRIVEVFEKIQIDEQQRTLLNIAGTRGLRLFQTIEQ